MIAIRKHRPTILLWIDALCINQSDDGEKSIEVGRMKDIYRNAKQVIAWLGPPADLSDDLIMKMNEAGSFLRSPRKKVELPITISSAWFEMSDLEKAGYMMSREARQHDWCRGTWMHYFIHFTISDDAEADLPRSALRAFLKRPFWRRVWIIQEFALSTDLYFQSGESRIDLEKFLEVYEFLCTRWAAIHTVPGLSEIEKAFEGLLYGGILAQVRTLIDIRKRLRQGKVMKIENLLINVFARYDQSYAFEATDPRDRVNGMLGLVASCVIRPDYSKSCVEVYTQVAEQLLQGGFTDILQYTTFPKKVPNLPSWVPDWSSTNDRMLQKVDSQGVSNAKDCPAQTITSFNFTSGPSHVRQLHIVGYVLGEIAHILPPSELPQNIGEMGLFSFFTSLTRKIEEACLHGCIQCHEARHKPTRETIARVLCANEVLLDGLYARFTSSQYQACYEFCTEEMPDLKSEMDKMAWAFMRDVFYHNEIRRPFVTSNGWLGIAPLHIQPGYLVCRLDGCKSPYILGGTETGNYNFFGECFIGANDQEAQERKQADLAKVNFCIE